MGALPKRKLSKGRRDRRRSHLALKTTSLVVCPECKNLRLPHRVCPTCGYYRGAARIEVEGGE
ncbi:MAG: 50S ribosomal protein L32 [Chloroflexi bacterium]|nr:50S ribosomal protein L32 [Chloroflexota bacterium]